MKGSGSCCQLARWEKAFPNPQNQRPALALGGARGSFSERQGHCARPCSCSLEGWREGKLVDQSFPGSGCSNQEARAPLGFQTHHLAERCQERRSLLISQAGLA